MGIGDGYLMLIDSGATDDGVIDQGCIYDSKLDLSFLVSRS